MQMGEFMECALALSYESTTKQESCIDTSGKAAGFAEIHYDSDEIGRAHV